LAKQGAASIAILARDQRKIDEALPLIRRAGASGNHGGTQVYGVSADVSMQVPVQAGCAEAIALMGGIDGVVCCAGASYPSLFLATTEADFERLMQVNFTGTMYVLKAVVPHMIRNNNARGRNGGGGGGEGGRIMLVSSMAGLSGVAGYTAYSASKFALRGMAEALHMELWGPHNIAVSLSNPPDVNTPMLARENEIKPKECRQISEGSGVFEAHTIAADLVDAMKHWRFLVNTGFDGQMLRLIATGTSPASSGAWATLELLSLGIIRTVSLGYRWYYNRIVRKVRLTPQQTQHWNHMRAAAFEGFTALNANFVFLCVPVFVLSFFDCPPGACRARGRHVGGCGRARVQGGAGGREEGQIKKQTTKFRLSSHPRAFCALRPLATF
jgi:3-dehydrosphinganine reductase